MEAFFVLLAILVVVVAILLTCNIIDTLNAIEKRYREEERKCRLNTAAE